MDAHNAAPPEPSADEVVDAAELDRVAAGRPVRIPHWEPGRTMVVLVGPVDVTAELLAHAERLGGIPNPLAGEVAGVFGASESSEASAEPARLDPEQLEALDAVMQAVCRQALRKPTYQDLEERGLRLTLPQRLAIFEACMGPAAELAPFRADAGVRGPGTDGAALRPEAV